MGVGGRRVATETSCLDYLWVGTIWLTQFPQGMSGIENRRVVGENSPRRIPNWRKMGAEILLQY